MIAVFPWLVLLLVLLPAPHCVAQSQPSAGTSINLKNVRSRQKGRSAPEVNIGLGQGQEPWRVRVRPSSGGGSVPGGNRELANMVRELQNRNNKTGSNGAAGASRGTTYVIIRDVEQHQAGTGNRQSMRVGNVSDTPASQAQ